VIEDVRGGVQDAGDGLEIAAEIRRQDFDAGVGQSAADARTVSAKCGEPPSGRSSRLTLVMTTTEVHLPGHARDVFGRLRIERAGVFGLRHGTESASAVHRLPRIMNVAALR